MSKKVKDLEVLEELVDIVKEEESDGEMELKPQPIAVKKRIYNVKPKDPTVPKRERTEAQKMAWDKALATRQANRDNRKTVKETENERITRELNEKKDLAKKQIEEKIVKKAISIKKKAIKKEIILDEISDDETPMEEIKKMVRKQPPRQVNNPQMNNPVPIFQKPQIIFM